MLFVLDDHLVHFARRKNANLHFKQGIHIVSENHINGFLPARTRRNRSGNLAEQQVISGHAAFALQDFYDHLRLIVVHGAHALTSTHGNHGIALDNGKEVTRFLERAVTGNNLGAQRKRAHVGQNDFADFRIAHFHAALQRSAQRNGGIRVNKRFGLATKHLFHEMTHHGKTRSAAH